MKRIALVTGASGLIGKTLLPELESRGFSPCILSRKSHESRYPVVEWSVKDGVKNLDDIEGAELVVHLAGASIAGKRWTEAYKQEIKESRVVGTRTLVRQLSAVKNPPKTFISASAVGIYGDRGAEILSETSAVGSGFLADVASEWEVEALNARNFGARVVIPRFGIILSKDGGALKQMYPPFSLGLGGALGDGSQWMSWISRRDAVNALSKFTEDTSLSGAFNVVAPNPVTNLIFTKALGGVLQRPTIFRIPARIVSLAFGEMGRALLLSSTRVIPDRLTQSGFQFLDPQIESGLKSALERMAPQRM